MVLSRASCAEGKDMVASGVTPRRRYRVRILSAVFVAAGAVQSDAARAEVTVGPSHFEPNRGQADPGVAFVSRGANFTMQLSVWEVRIPLNGDVVTVSLLGVNRASTGEAVGALPGKSNYFIGSDPTKWRTAVPHYSKVRYEEIYPRVDVLYYGNRNHLEYDFTVRPGGDPRTIRMRIDAPLGIRIDETGDLVFASQGGELRMRKPLAYQEHRGARQLVRARYELDSSNTVRFRIGRYDEHLPLVIDPVLDYATFLGGSVGEAGNAIAVDGAGNTYVGGITSSLDFPKVAPLQPVFAGGAYDSFVSKYSPDGTLLYSTYLGGSGSFDDCYGIAADFEGNAYIVGSTNSSNFPIVNAIQSTNAGLTDAFLTKIAPDGSAIVFSTYLGGTKSDVILDLALDGSSNIHLGGFTTSTNFPTKNPIQAVFAGGTRDAFAVKIHSSGSSLLYSTYMGGSAIDECRGIAVDGAGSVYLTGDTSSTDFPVANALQATLRGSNDTFVTKINAEGSAIVYSTYLGGSSGDDSEGLKLIAVDIAGDAYVTGSTRSSDFPVHNALQPSIVSTRDAFVARIDASGSALVFSTYLGASDSDDGYDIALDAFGNVYVGGQTESPDFPVVDPAQPVYGGGLGDAFVTVIRGDGSEFLYSTYLGGIGEDRGNSIALDSAGNVQVTGQTGSADFPTVNPHQPSYGGSGDAFVAQIRSVVPPAALASVEWPGGSTASLAWTGVLGATTYQVYRGDDVDLPKLLSSEIDSCQRLSTSDLTTGPVIVEEPAPGRFHWYLIRAENANGLGPAGHATAGPRIHDSSGDCAGP